MSFLKGFIVWVFIIFAESLHGVIRVLIIEPSVGDFRARQIAVFTGSLMIFLIAFLFIRWMGAESAYQLIAIGLLWLCLTVGFEILFGRVVMGFSWERISSDYNILNGGLLPIGLLVLIVSPLAAAKLQGLDLIKGHRRLIPGKERFSKS